MLKPRYNHIITTNSSENDGQEYYPLPPHAPPPKKKYIYRQIDILITVFDLLELYYRMEVLVGMEMNMKHMGPCGGTREKPENDVTFSDGK